MLSGRKIGFIGSGFMAEALVKGLRKSGMAKPADITMTDIRADRLEYMEREYSVQTSGDNEKMIKENDMIILA
ncbi:MAG: NAD(P)-binding domain-containing protein, partial [Nitrospinota bacterium]|nr:NAD(P)-binding domain-containing protein [Nitrospinota bacterium]